MAFALYKTQKTLEPGFRERKTPDFRPKRSPRQYSVTRENPFASADLADVLLIAIVCAIFVMLLMDMDILIFAW